jgi:DNA polymerase-3 subunit alpha (Gram-positive type)
LSEQTLLYEVYPFLREEKRLATDYSGARVVFVKNNGNVLEIAITLTSPVPPYELSIMEDVLKKNLAINAVRLHSSISSRSNESSSANVSNSAKSKSTSTKPSQSPAQSNTKLIPNKKNIIMGRVIKAAPKVIENIALEDGTVVIKGVVCNVDNRQYNFNSWQLNFDLTDYTGTLNVRKSLRDDNASKIIKAIKKDMHISVHGVLYHHNRTGELTLDPQNIFINEFTPRHDNAENKRVELHIHTKMSATDAVSDVKDIVRRAIEWNHKAIAITDHGVVQAFPDAAATVKALKSDIKVIYGMEGYYIDDINPDKEDDSTSFDSESTSDDVENGLTSDDSSDVVSTGSTSSKKRSKRRQSFNHIIILVKNRIGLKNLYKLVTISHLEHHSGRRPIIFKSVLEKHREGLILGTACDSGELLKAIVKQKDDDTLLDIAKFYDYLEIQPLCNNNFMLYSQSNSPPKASSEEDLRNFNRKIVEIAKKINKPVVATCDSHFLDPEQEIFRKIILTGKGFDSANDDLPLFFRTTDEMLEEFSYLGEETAYEAVVTNPNKIADMCEFIKPLPDEKKLYAPKLKGSSEELTKLVTNNFKNLYGENPPEFVKDRFGVELKDILDFDYDVIYMAAQKVIAEAAKADYVVGSRGSVGSSFIAFLAGITEVNALPPHYRCTKCKTSEFFDEKGDSYVINYGCGVDMPKKICPKCNIEYIKDGFNIPFETFLGFDGTKVPDIDLNFSGEYQDKAHKDFIDLFGSDYVFRAGTITSLSKETPYGYVRKYNEKHGRIVSKAEENRLVKGCEDVKTSTGQHPGGFIVIPQDMEITDFTPLQHPADAKDKGIITTHIDFKRTGDILIKLDMLGHDNPTMFRMLKDMTGIDAQDIPLDDPKTLAIFSSPKSLGLSDKDKIIGTSGTLGIPEFGTDLVREMLAATSPKDVDTLIRISGFSHGTAVWQKNAETLIADGKPINELVACRDDVMNFLISKGIDSKSAFNISEWVRSKKHGLPEGAENLMRTHNIPDWYINSCKMIEYLFPKAHATAYVMDAVRVAWFKVHKPLEYYSAYFYRRSMKGRFDAELMVAGINNVIAKIRVLRADKKISVTDKKILETLESCYEFYLRGFKFADIDLYKSDALKFTVVDDNTLRPPFVSIAGLGAVAANSLANVGKKRKFVSTDDILRYCTKVNKNNIEKLRELGALKDLPDTSQMSLF